LGFLVAAGAVLANGHGIAALSLERALAAEANTLIARKVRLNN